MQQAASPPVRVLMADDHPILLAGLQALVGSDPDLQIVGEARDGRTALQLALDLRPDVVVLDVSMPEMNGIEVTRALRAAWPECRILVLTVHEDRAYLWQLLEAGVSGFLLKRSASEELTRALHAIHAGGVYLDPAIAGQVVGRVAQIAQRGSPAGAAELSERETEVLHGIAQGHSNKEIAVRCEISVKTVETYKARAMEKLGLRNRAELVRYAADKGWLADS